MKHCRYLLIISLFCVLPASGQEGQNRLMMLFSDTTMFQCTALNINTHASDFGMTRYQSGYVFASSRNAHVGIQHYATDTLSPLLDLYYFEKKDSARFSHPRPFDRRMNTPLNDGPVVFSKNGELAICTRSFSVRDGEGAYALALTSSIKHNRKWSTPTVLPFCNPGYNYVNPAFAENDSLLFFASDCRGGYGGMDIWYVRLGAGGWGTPINLGPKINTADDETFPFCTASGNLYFSSNRPGGYGQLDLYAWTLSDSLYMKPQLLAQPLNSTADDFSFSCNADETEGFFASNRNHPVTDDDLYTFRLRMQHPSVTDTLRKPVLCYTFIEDASYSHSDTASMKYTWSFSDGTIAHGLKVHKCFDTTGVYSIHLDIRDSSSGEVILSAVDYDLDITPPNPISVFVPDTIPMHEPLTIRSQNATLQGYSLDAVYYDFGRGYTCEGTTASHVYHHPGTYYPKIFFRLKSRDTGAEECRCLVAKIIVQ